MSLGRFLAGVSYATGVEIVGWTLHLHWWTGFGIWLTGIGLILFISWEES